MGLEKEAKFALAAFGPLRAALALAGGVMTGRRFEANVVLDGAGSGLTSRGWLLRLRSDGRNTLTLKLPAPETAPPGLKVRREIETKVEDFDAALEILGHLGFAPALRYEKIRETWALPGLAVCLDRLPFGRFAELEGDGQAIVRAAAELGLDMNRAMAVTYHDLNRENRAGRGLAPRPDFVFAPAWRERLLTSEGLLFLMDGGDTAGDAPMLGD